MLLSILINNPEVFKFSHWSLSHTVDWHFHSIEVNQSDYRLLCLCSCRLREVSCTGNTIQYIQSETKNRKNKMFQYLVLKHQKKKNHRTFVLWFFFFGVWVQNNFCSVFKIAHYYSFSWFDCFFGVYFSIWC